jgi:hypothetical protein
LGRSRSQLQTHELPVSYLDDLAAILDVFLLPATANS